MTAPGTDPPSPRLVALGEALVDISPHTPGASLADGGLLEPHPGGAPANVAVAAARLGVASAFLGAIGSDPLGGLVHRALTASGVDASGTTTVATPTAVAFVAVAEDGEREFIFYGRPAAHDQLTTATVDAYFVRQPLTTNDVLHLSSNCLTREPARRASLHAVDLACASGATVSFDINLRPALWDGESREQVLEVLRPVLDRAQIVKLSLDELDFYTGQRSHAAAQTLATDLLARAASCVAVTLGPQGAWYFTRTHAGSVPGFAVTAVDTTGAGDAFTAAVIAATLRNPAVWQELEATESALYDACAYAALSTTRQGGIPSFALRGELIEFRAATAGQHGR